MEASCQVSHEGCQHAANGQRLEAREASVDHALPSWQQPELSQVGPGFVASTCTFS